MKRCLARRYRIRYCMDGGGRCGMDVIMGKRWCRISFLYDLELYQARYT
jgi:hypothetical protein